MKIWVNITAEDGELLERFAVLPTDGAETPGTKAIMLASAVREVVEMRFSVEDSDAPHASKISRRIFTMELRPVSLSTLPSGITYELTALPRDSWGIKRPDLPASRFRYGEFRLSPEPTREQMRDFSITEVIPS